MSEWVRSTNHFLQNSKTSAICVFWCERKIYCDVWNFLGLSSPVEAIRI